MADLLGNIFDEVHSAIQNWRPQKEFNKEIDCRDDLVEFLRKTLNQQNYLGIANHFNIQTESGRHLCDIGINRRIGIELKLDLRTKSQADRLFGQVDGFLDDYVEGVIIVLCGKTDMQQVDYLKDKLSKYSQPTIYGGKIMKIITKSFKKPSRQQAGNPFEINLPEVPDIKFPDIHF